MSVNIVSTKGYDNVQQRRRKKDKANSKPKALGMVNAGEAIPKLRLRLPRFQAVKSNLTNYEMLNPEQGHLTEYDLKKQSQFVGGINECKLLCDK